MVIIRFRVMAIRKAPCCAPRQPMGMVSMSARCNPLSRLRYRPFGYMQMLPQLAACSIWLNFGVGMKSTLSSCRSPIVIRPTTSLGTGGALGSFTDLTAYATNLDFTSSLNYTPDADTDAIKSWVKDLVRTDEQAARATLFAQAVNHDPNGGAPSGGTYKVAVVQGDTTVTTVDAIAYNASPSAVESALNNMSNGQPFLNDILTSGFVVNGVGPDKIPGTVTSGSATITGITPGIVEQVKDGFIVSSSPSNVFPDGTVVVSTDSSVGTVTVNNQATGSSSLVSLFQPSTWSIAFNNQVVIPAKDMPDVRIILDELQPQHEVLGKVVPGFNPSQDATSFMLSVFKSPYVPKEGQSWLELLAEQTGPGKLYSAGTAWKYPTALMPVPDGIDMQTMGSVNFWRMPDGPQSKALSFAGGWGDFTRKGIYRGELPGTGDPSYFSSQPMNNEAFFFDLSGSYNPYQTVYTYVITWTPKRLAQYVLPAMSRNGELPNINIDDLEPIVEYTIEEYASLSQSGPSVNQNGQGVYSGDVPFAYTELAEKIGDASINIANYFGYGQAGQGLNGSASVTADLTKDNAIVTNVNSFAATANIVKGEAVINNVVVPGEQEIKVNMQVTSVTPNQIASGSYVKKIEGNKITLSIPGALNVSGADIRFFDMVNVDGNSVSWVPQIGQLVTGSAFGGQTAKVVSTDKGNSTVTLNIAPSQTQVGATITMQTNEAISGWSGPPPSKKMPDGQMLVKSVGFFELKDMESDGAKTSDFNIVAPSHENDNFWVDFSNQTVWTDANWKSKITKFFNIQYTNPFTHLGALPGFSLSYPNKSPANVDLVKVGENQFLALKVGMNDLTLNEDKTNWQTPPANNFYQVSAVAPSGQVSESNPLLRVEVYKEGDSSLYWTANTPVLSSTYIYALDAGDDPVDLTVNLWVLNSGTLPRQQPLPAPDYTATITISTDPHDGPTYTVKSDPNNILANPSGSAIVVHNPNDRDYQKFINADNGFFLVSTSPEHVEDEDHPKSKGRAYQTGIVSRYQQEQFGEWFIIQPWVYSSDLKAWIFPYEDDVNDLWAWSSNQQWMWFSFYPYFYMVENQAWGYAYGNGFYFDFKAMEWKLFSQ